ncbi:MAG TPA: hypothetical protein VLB86_15315 [Gaiellaceae bacterium]|nr:hypothetical protein [Gaiellaceae bacterium]
MRRRWEPDERGRGVASAEAFVPDADALRAAMAQPDWVAEEPEHHLVPHLERACAAAGSTLRLDGWTVEDGVLVVDLSFEPSREEPFGRWRARREAVFRLIGTIAEPATLVRELVADRDFVVVTGVLEGDSAFAPHGHTLRLRVGSGPTAA